DAQTAGRPTAGKWVLRDPVVLPPALPFPGALQPQARPVTCKRHHGQEVFCGGLRGGVYEAVLKTRLRLARHRDGPCAEVRCWQPRDGQCRQGFGTGAEDTPLHLNTDTTSKLRVTLHGYPLSYLNWRECDELRAKYWSELVNFAILGLPGNNFVKHKRKQIIAKSLLSISFHQNRFRVQDLDKQEPTVPDDGMTFPCPQGRNVQARSTSTGDTNAFLLTLAGYPALLAAPEPAFPTTPQPWSREAHSLTLGSTAQRHCFLLWLPFSSQRQRWVREKASPPSGSPGRKAESSGLGPYSCPDRHL
ncbi:hypothetical protein E2I00_002456, partial [Balaenoptera physalus]